jgi:spore coat protein U-like protein
MKKFIFSTIAIFGFFAVSNAQTTASASHNVSLNLSNAIEISFTAGGSGVSLAFSTADHYNDGVEAANAATIRVRSNKAYNVTVKAGAANFTSASATTMPVSGVLAVKESNQSSFLGLSASDQNLLTNQSRGVNNFNVSYRATPGFNYDAGTYTVSVIYTATQN